MNSFIDALKQYHETVPLPELRIAYADFWPEWKDENFIEPILKKHFDVVIDQKNPSVVFHSIFGGMQETPKYKCKKVLFLGENYRAKNYGSNFSISFDPHSDTNFRLPLWQAYILLRPEYKDRLFKRVNHEQFDRFCSFTVSNPNNFFRNGFYKQLSSYKMVHSYGRYMTNDQGLQKASEGKYWRDAKDLFFQQNKHKFAITYEHSSYPWYCTEKLMDTFLAGSMPLYWGDPKVKEDWNEKAFINVLDYGRNIMTSINHPTAGFDNNKRIFDTKYNEPVFTDSQKDKLVNNLSECEDWLLKIVK